jgi:hypothetical protein
MLAPVSAYWLLPLNCSALPVLPATGVGPLTSVASCPLPDVSGVVAPLTWSSGQYPTPVRPGVPGGGGGGFATSAAAASTDALTTARTRFASTLRTRRS